MAQNGVYGLEMMQNHVYRLGTEESGAEITMTANQGYGVLTTGQQTEKSSNMMDRTSQLENHDYDYITETSGEL